MTLKCIKSKSTLFTAGRSYKILATDMSESDPQTKIYLLETNRGSMCYTELKGVQAIFEKEAITDDL